MSVRWIFDTPKVVSMPVAMQGFTPKLSFGKIGSPPPIQDRDLPKWVAPTQTDRFEYTGQTAEGKPLASQVSSLINGGQIFNQVAQVMNQAKSSVLLDLYNLQNPALYPEKASEADIPGMVQQSQIIQRLVELKEKGLKVKVILDNHWDRDLNEGSNQRTINFLRSKGIETLTYPDFAKISHVKLMIVDDKFAVIGGMNWGNHSPSNHDAAVFIEGEDVRNLYTQIFKTDWLTAGGAPESLPDIEPFEPEVSSESKIKVLTTSPKDSVDGGSRSIFNELMKQIGKAQESIYAELFVLTQPDIVDNLIFAHKRLKKNGKEGVKILVDPGLYFSFPNTRKGVQKLANAGVPIQFYKANRMIEEKLHAKWAVFDEKKLMIGSANWSAVGLQSNADQEEEVESVKTASLKGNHEANVLIESAKVCKAFVDQFKFDWKSRSFPILVKNEDGSGSWKKLVPSSLLSLSTVSEPNTPGTLAAFA